MNMPTTNKVANVLALAKAIISDKLNWTQGYMARTSLLGQGCNVRSTEAVCFCSIGAVNLAVAQNPIESARRYTSAQTIETKARRALEVAAQKISGNKDISVVQFNDRRSHKSVMSMFDLAIHNLENGIYD